MNGTDVHGFAINLHPIFYISVSILMGYQICVYNFVYERFVCPICSAISFLLLFDLFGFCFFPDRNHRIPYAVIFEPMKDCSRYM